MLVSTKFLLRKLVAENTEGREYFRIKLVCLHLLELTGLEFGKLSSRLIILYYKNINWKSVYCMNDE